MLSSGELMPPCHNHDDSRLASDGGSPSRSSGLAACDSYAQAQFGGPGGQAPVARPGILRDPVTAKLKAPAAFQVFQRDVNDKADIPIVLDESVKDGKLVGATLNRIQGNSRITFNESESKLVGVPVGGPYTINCQVKLGDKNATATIANIYVGDLWVLAGQSNMEGVGDLVDVTPSSPRVLLLGMDGRTGESPKMPLHWLVDLHQGPGPLRRPLPGRARSTAQQHKNRKKGAGLGLPFAVTMVEATGVPVGLVAIMRMAEQAWTSGARPKKSRGKQLGMVRCYAEVNLAAGQRSRARLVVPG